MSDTPYDLKDAITELTTAMKPLAVLADSMRGLDRSYHLQVDLQLIEQYYSESERKGLYSQLDDAYKAEAEATETLTLRNNRGSDQRSFEQYSRAHGPDQAKKAFMTDDEFTVLCNAAKLKTSELRTAHPVLFRVHARAKSSW